MARSDLILKLAQSGMKGDKQLLQKTIEALISEEKSKNRSLFAKQLQDTLIDNEQGISISNLSGNKIEQIIFEKEATKNIDTLILDDDVKKTLSKFIEEQHRYDILRAYNLEPRNKVLLVGPPGNGKTSVAECIAERLMVPFYIIRYEGIISSFLGETANKLKILFDFIRTQRCVVFFDEFDSIGKERGDIHETGEIKRVVSSLLLQIDRLPSYVVIVTATNHPELLDKAVWRRFQIRLQLEKPSPSEIEDYLRLSEKKYGHSLSLTRQQITKYLKGLSYSEIEEFVLDINRQYVLSLPSSNLKKIVREKFKELENRYINTTKELE